MEFSLNNRKLKYEDDKIFIWCDSGSYKKNPKYKEISLWDNKDRKYITIGNKSYQYHRVLGYAFLGLDIEDNKQVIMHLDGNKQNNTLSNLQLVSNSYIHHNKKDTKGYYQCNKTKKFKAQITIDGITKYLGSYDTEEEAHDVYVKENNKILNLYPFKENYEEHRDTHIKESFLKLVDNYEKELNKLINSLPSSKLRDTYEKIFKDSINSLASSKVQ